MESGSHCLARIGRRACFLALALGTAAGLVASGPLPVLGAGGDLDTGFGNAGVALTNFGADEFATAVAIQKNGKLVTVGHADSFALARYGRDGSPDEKIEQPVVAGENRARAVAIQKDGKILVAGFARVNGDRDFAVARYRRDLSLDLAFGPGGVVTVDFNGNDDLAYSVAVERDRRIVLAGEADTGLTGVRFALARLLPEGTLDPTFGTGGKVTTSFGPGEAVARALVVQPDRKLVAAGWAADGAGFNFALAGYLSNGAPDPGFGATGKVTTNFPGAVELAVAAALQKDRKIVVAGLAQPTGDFDFALARYNANGSPDSSFAGAGRVTTDFDGGDDEATGVAVQRDGQIVAGGSADVGGSRFAAARYTAAGGLDTAFGTGGRVTTDLAGASESAFALALQKDGAIVLAGEAHVAPGFRDFALIRLMGQ